MEVILAGGKYIYHKYHCILKETGLPQSVRRSNQCSEGTLCTE